MYDRKCENCLTIIFRFTVNRLLKYVVHLPGWHSLHFTLIIIWQYLQSDWQLLSAYGPGTTCHMMWLQPSHYQSFYQRFKARLFTKFFFLIISWTGLYL